MSACGALCQHPACWASEINAKRKAIERIHNRLVADDNHDKQDEELPLYLKDRKQDVLPSYNILNLHEDIPTVVAVKEEQARLDRFAALYLEKLRSHVTEVSQSEAHKTSQAKCNFKEFKLCAAQEETTAASQERFYVWLPGKKTEKIKESNAWLTNTIIDGESLPQDCLHNHGKSHQDLRSGGNVRHHNSRVPLFVNEQVANKYEFDELFRFVMAIEEGKLGKESPASPRDVPSQLCARQMPILEERTKPVTKSPPQATATVTKSQAQPSTVGSKLPPQPSFGMQRKTRENKRKTKLVRENIARDLLPLTRVSVPRRAILKYPISDHCSSSIRQAGLPDVAILPLDESEVNLEIFTAQASPRQASSASTVQPSPPRISPNKHALSEVSHATSEIENATEAGKMTSPSRHITSPSRDVTLPRPPSQVSVISCQESKALSESEVSIQTSSKVSKVASKAPSSRASSKTSMDSSNEREFRQRTYETYQSFSLFKSPSPTGDEQTLPQQTSECPCEKEKTPEGLVCENLVEEEHGISTESTSDQKIEPLTSDDIESERTVLPDERKTNAFLSNSEERIDLPPSFSDTDVNAAPPLPVDHSNKTSPVTRNVSFKEQPSVISLRNESKVTLVDESDFSNNEVEPSAFIEDGIEVKSSLGLKNETEASKNINPEVNNTEGRDANSVKKEGSESNEREQRSASASLSPVDTRSLVSTNRSSPVSDRSSSAMSQLSSWDALSEYAVDFCEGLSNRWNPSDELSAAIEGIEELGIDSYQLIDLQW